MALRTLQLYISGLSWDIEIKKDGIRKLINNHYETTSVMFFVQVKIQVTTGQKVKFEKKNIFLDDNVFDFEDRTTILAASCLSRQHSSKHL